MPNRVLKDSIRCSAEIDSLTWFQEVCFYRLMVTVDDYGRYYGNPQIIKSELFPTKEDLTKAAITEALDTLEKVGLITRYEVEGKQYLQITKWNKHQQRRATKSKFPDCDGYQLKSIDINCNQMISDDSKCNHMNSDDSGCDQMKSIDINCNQLSPYSKSNTNTKSMMVSAGARAREGDTIITDEEAFSIQKDHDEIFSAMEDAGFEMSNGMMKNATDLYDKYGKEAMLGAIEKCIGCTGNKLRYLQKILENRDVPKPSGNCMSHEETAELEKNMFW